MKLSSIKSEANLLNDPEGHDIDVIDKLGPSIHKHLGSLEALCKLIPDNIEIAKCLANLKNELSRKIQIQSNVLEYDKTHNPQNEIPSISSIIEMYNEYHNQIGEAAWVAVTKHLINQGHPKDKVYNLIDEAISTKK